MTRGHSWPKGHHNQDFFFLCLFFFFFFPSFLVLLFALTMSTSNSPIPRAPHCGSMPELVLPVAPTFRPHQHCLSCQVATRPLTSLSVFQGVSPSSKLISAKMIMAPNEMRCLISQGRNAGTECTLQVHEIQYPLSGSRKSRGLSAGAAAGRLALNSSS